MSPENTSYLRFSLEESVWFPSGQEVSELYSISLEPNVSVHEVEQYIILRGTLDLTGEYRPQEGNETREEELNRRYVSITDQREDMYEFQHRFPVDITVPAERVGDKAELSVGVQSFDYHLPEEGRLYLTAELWISGIQEDVIEREEEEVEIASPSEAVNLNEEASLESAEEILIEEKAEEIPLYRSSAVEEEEEEEEDGSEEELTPFSFPSYPSFGKESSNDEDEFYAEARIPPEQQVQNEEEFDKERDFLNDLPTLKERAEPSAYHSANAADEEEEAAPAYRSYKQEEYARKVPKEEEPRRESAKAAKTESKSLLYDLFSPEEEAKQAKLKVYIVQGNETIDSLAERYHISAQHIARVNRIGEIDSLRAGQVIYIPVTAPVNKSAE